MVKKASVIVVVMMLVFAPSAAAKPTNPLCADGAYRRAHPLICDTGQNPFTVTPGGGGGNGGGLIGRIIDVIGGLL